ncbi:MAG: DUF1302 family protein [Stagnimonas sp.]|nr:DUF1302 family protein [Stagnimonas sp.]
MRGRQSRISLLTVLAGSLTVAGAARAGSFELWGTEGDYKLTTNYALAMRTKHPDQALINSPVDPLVAGGPVTEGQLGPGQPAQPATFNHTGLPAAINSDDGTRNFKRYSLVHNRASAFGEMEVRRGGFGLVFSGDAFVDAVYRSKNDNDSPEVAGRNVNTMGIAANEFVAEARHYDGLRARLLDAYAYLDHQFTDEIALNLRVGQQVVAWGESLFLRGIALSQGRADATRSSVPGAEIKELLLPGSQVGLQLSLNDRLTLLGYYKLDFAATELFPQGDFLSPADLIGPGGTFTYGSINPAYGDGCEGMLPDPFPESVNATICGTGLPGPLTNSQPYIYVYRAEDINPSDWGQWGTGLKFAATPQTTLGLFFLRYADANPTVQLNTGFAPFGEDPVTGTPVTTQIINQYVPTTYNVKYFGNIHLYGSSFSTTIGPLNVGGEINYHQGIDTQVQAIIAGVRSPVFTRADIGQFLVSAIWAGNPQMVFDDLAVVAEAAYHHVYSVDAFEPQLGIAPVGDGKQLFGNRNSWGYQTLALGTRRNVMSGWDLKGQFSWGAIGHGNPSISGQFGPIYGEGDMRLGVGTGLQYLQNFEVGVSYQKFFGDAERVVRGSPQILQNPYADRDYVTLNFKYSL